MQQQQDGLNCLHLIFLQATHNGEKATTGFYQRDEWIAFVLELLRIEGGDLSTGHRNGGVRSEARNQLILTVVTPLGSAFFQTGSGGNVYLRLTPGNGNPAEEHRPR